jgi:hypothetical protein
MNTYLRIAAALLVIGAMMPTATSANEEVGAAPTIASSVADDIQPRTIGADVSTSGADPTFGAHLVWPVDRSQTPDSVEQGLLYVFLPATGNVPGDYTLIQREALDLGYHVIGLAYPNKDAVVKLCNPLPDINIGSGSRQQCYEDVRLQTIDGTPRYFTDMKGGQQTYTKVDTTNSIDNRLVTLLSYLTTTYPREGWQGFLRVNDANILEPDWSHIVVAGHSQGGGNAAMIGKLHRVARVAMISSPPDGCFNAANLPAALPGCSLDHQDYTIPADWARIGLTPADRYYGLAHVGEFAIEPIEANWGAFGLGAFGKTVIADPPATPPNTCSHMLLTTVASRLQDVVVPLQDHRLTARDTYTPLAHGDNGPPLLRNAWRYISAVTPTSVGACAAG